jgi:hypothetical protein
VTLKVFFKRSCGLRDRRSFDQVGEDVRVLHMMAWPEPESAQYRAWPSAWVKVATTVLLRPVNSAFGLKIKGFALLLFTVQFIHGRGIK